uniref:Uncharacterized protein n=1 Tax=Ignisphaera aggregans TaxID=334771 RepID=A0A7J3QEU3_9CREN
MSSKSLRAQYINIFLLCNNINIINTINEAIDRICRNSICNYTISQSKVIDRFFYIKVMPLNVEKLEELRKLILISIENYKNELSWYKIETIEVK